MSLGPMPSSGDNRPMSTKYMPGKGQRLFHHQQVGRGSRPPRAGWPSRRAANCHSAQISSSVKLLQLGAAAYALQRPAYALASAFCAPSRSYCSSEVPCAAPTSVPRREGSAGPRSGLRVRMAVSSIGVSGGARHDVRDRLRSRSRSALPFAAVKTAVSFPAAAPMPAVKAAHLLWHRSLHAPHGVVHGGRDQVFQHFPCRRP